METDKSYDRHFTNSVGAVAVVILFIKVGQDGILPTQILRN